MKNVKLVALACLALPALASAEYTIQDGKNVMKIGGQLGTSIQTGSNQDYTNGDSAKFNSVTVNTANIHFAGAIQEKLVYKLRLKMAPVTTKTANDTNDGHDHSTYNMIDYAMAGYAFAPELTVVMGKVDFGAGFDFNSSSMSPLSFTQDQDLFFGSGTANGVRAFGTFMDMFDYSLTAVNDYDSDSKYQSGNDNKSMDYIATVAAHTKDAADAEGYNAGGDFKYYTAVDFAQTSNGSSTSDKRQVLAGTGFFSYQNAILHVAATTQKSKQASDDFWTVGAGYLINKTWRPGFTVSSVRSSEQLDGLPGKFTYYAANVTMFHDDNKWRNYFEVNMVNQSKEEKDVLKAANKKDVTPWSVMAGLTVNI